MRSSAQPGFFCTTSAVAGVDAGEGVVADVRSAVGVEVGAEAILRASIASRAETIGSCEGRRPTR